MMYLEDELISLDELQEKIQEVRSTPSLGRRSDRDWLKLLFTPLV
jgi:hypothetical protein